MAPDVAKPLLGVLTRGAGGHDEHVVALQFLGGCVDEIGEQAVQRLECPWQSEQRHEPGDVRCRAAPVGQQRGGAVPPHDDVVPEGGEDGDHPDWIELLNITNAEVNLDGWFLSDDPLTPMKWRFPAVTLPGRGYLVVFASEKDRAVAGAPLHTNFALSAGGDSHFNTCRRYRPV